MLQRNYVDSFGVLRFMKLIARTRRAPTTAFASTASASARKAGKVPIAPRWTATRCSACRTARAKAPLVSSCTNACARKDGVATTVPSRRAASIVADTVDAKPVPASVTKDGPANSVKIDCAILGKWLWHGFDRHFSLDAFLQHDSISLLFGDVTAYIPVSLDEHCEQDLN